MLKLEQSIKKKKEASRNCYYCHGSVMWMIDQGENTDDRQNLQPVHKTYNLF